MMQFTFSTYRGRHQFVLSALEHLRGKPYALLDVGNLGDGASTCMLLRNEVREHDGRYVGLDSNEPLTRRLNLPDQVVGDLLSAPFPDVTFDAIYAGELLEHTWEPSVMIQECYRLLKPGGVLILDTPNPYSIVNIVRFLLHRRDSMGDNRTLTYHEAANAFDHLKGSDHVLLQPQHKIFYTPAMLRQLLECHGFRMETIGCTTKARSLLHRICLRILPHTGPHLCCTAIKTTVEEAFADVRHCDPGSQRTSTS